MHTLDMEEEGMQTKETAIEGCYLSGISPNQTEGWQFGWQKLKLSSGEARVRMGTPPPPPWQHMGKAGRRGETRGEWGADQGYTREATIGKVVIPLTTTKKVHYPTCDAKKHSSAVHVQLCLHRSQSFKSYRVSGRPRACRESGGKK